MHLREYVRVRSPIRMFHQRLEYSANLFYNNLNTWIFKRRVCNPLFLRENVTNEITRTAGIREASAVEKIAKIPIGGPSGTTWYLTG